MTDEYAALLAEEGLLSPEERREMSLMNLAQSKASKAKNRKKNRQKKAVKKLTEAERRAREQKRIQEEREIRRTLSEANRREAGIGLTAEPEPDEDPAAVQPETMPTAEAPDGIDVDIPKAPAKPSGTDTAAARSGKNVRRKSTAVSAKQRTAGGRYSAGVSSVSAYPNRITAGSAIMFGVLTVALIGLVIYGRVQTNEAYTRIAALQAEYDDLVAQNVSMKSEMEGKMTVKNIEEYAENVLGLMPLNQSQIEYIQLQTEDEVAIAETDDSIFVVINDYLVRFWEFLSGK